MNQCKQVCNLCQGRYCARKVSIFSILQEEQLAEVTDKINIKKFKKGEMLFFEGDISDKLFLINKGKIKAFRYTKDGKEQIIYILAEGDFIGDMSLIKEGEFKFNAEAMEDSNVCILTKDDFDKILLNNPDIALKILKVIHERVANLEDQIQRLGTKDIESRLAGLLLSLIKDFGTPMDTIVELDIPLSREDMANYIGSTRETVSRKLSSLQDEGIIELIGNKKIIIKDLNALENLA
ncbi:Crp/Fnr family transcriptional regulator [Clostridium sp. D2Q-11]|uniref:Crp/Fnr family transcriptional regulator n=1 Tax=Anaeromonas frigoriresistens TaxID=2683708 RepID=A0A942UR23_9FIRM|nr:Crp/Fnr family transcriptional regulator [Anaeromonas frigoriresistens]MBS4537633.1 Crp/Fnr family transcriptional regulator [Anaeromonas frigoriresistens]